MLKNLLKSGVHPFMYKWRFFNKNQDSPTMQGLVEKNYWGFIPWKRKSSAYGYAQVLTETWKEYVKQTKNRGADRDRFKDSIDFVGWYTSKTQQITKVSKWDAYNQYLAYHEGRGGYVKGTYKNKSWLMNVAKKVDKNAKIYALQLKSCQ